MLASWVNQGKRFSNVNFLPAGVTNDSDLHEA
jgi:hypothetical protein